MSAANLLPLSEQLIVVNDSDEATGWASKHDMHRGNGVLHRAFSVYLFDSRSRLLLQRRSQSKPLWPGFWSNSCCSHPRRGETIESAARRRLREELGVDASNLRYLFKFRYHARFGEVGSEHEVCSVFLAHADLLGKIDTREVAEYKFVSPRRVDTLLETEPQSFTPWLKIAWPRIRAHHWEIVTGGSYDYLPTFLNE